MSARRKRPGSIASPGGALDRAGQQWSLLRLYGADPDVMRSFRSLARVDHADPAAFLAAARLYGLDAIEPVDVALRSMADWVEVAKIRRAQHHRLPAFPVASSVGGGLSPNLDTHVRVGSWDPEVEPRTIAEARLIGCLHGELDRIEAEAHRGGLEWPDTALNRDRDLLWLFKRIRHGLSWPDLARQAGAGYDVDAVREAVHRAAEKVGVRL